MPRKLLLQSFEVGCSEVWSWLTDLLVGVTRQEQRIGLREYPDEELTFTTAFGEQGGNGLNGQDAIVNSLADLVACEGEVEVPMWHLSDSVALAGTAWIVGTQIAELHFSATYTPFEVCVGEQVLVQVAGAWTRGTAVLYNASAGYVRVDFGSPLGVGIEELRQVVPLRLALITSQSQITFPKFGAAADSEVTVRLQRGEERTAWGTGHALNTTGSFGWPVIEPRNMQDVLQLKIESGNTLLETPTGFPYYVTRWKEAGLTTSFRHRFRRYSPGMRYWRAFASALRGSQKEFWYPTRRSDFEVMSMIGVAGVRLRGRQFFDLWTETNLKALCLDSGADPICVRFAATCELDGDDTLVGFESDLPWATPVRQCSLALPCRIEGDSFKFVHDKSATAVEFGIASVVVDYPIGGESPVDADLLAHIDASTTFVRFDSDANYQRVTVDGSIGGTAEPLHEQGPPIGVVNNLRVMAFEPRGFDPSELGVEVFLWADTDSLRIDHTNAFGISTPIGSPVPTLRTVADKAVPWPMIVQAGRRGVARWALTFDGITPFGLSKVTKANASEPDFELFFADGDYSVGDYWTTSVKAFLDTSGEGNDLVSPSNLTLAHEGDRYYTDGNSSQAYTCAELANGREVTGPMTVVVVGRAYGSTANRVLWQGGSGQRRIETNGSGNVRLVGGSTSAAVPGLNSGDWYLIVATFNGASSVIHILKNDDEVWTVGNVNEGGAATPLNQVKWGANFMGCHAVFAAEGIPDDVGRFREGFAHKYLFRNTYQNTQMASPGDTAGAWSVLHSNAEEWVLSTATEIGEPNRDTTTLLEVVNNAGTGGFRLEWLKNTLEMRVTFLGLGPGTFSQDYPIGFVGTTIFEVRFADGAAECFLEGVNLGAMFPSDPGFLFSGVQENPLIVGKHEGFSFGELILRRGSTLQTDYLVDKWVSPVVAEFLLDEDDGVLLDESGLPLIEE